MSYLKNLKWRYATKRMNSEEVSSKKLKNILKAIRLSPSSLGLQPFSVIEISDKETKEKIAPACYNQPQITECSTLLVFAAWEKIPDDAVDKYIENISKTRNETIESTVQFRGMIDGFLSSMNDEQKFIWAAKQTYIALGFGLAAAALEKVDSTPMEGFNPVELDKVLNLNELNLKSTVLLALGYRNEKEDYLTNKKKVRRSDEDFYIKM